MSNAINLQELRILVDEKLAVAKKLRRSASDLKSIKALYDLVESGKVGYEQANRILNRIK